MDSHCQGGTSSGYGHVLWGVYSTLAPGERHILKLKYRTPTSLHVEWDPVWGSGHRGYILEATQLHSVFKVSILHFRKITFFDPNTR